MSLVIPLAVRLGRADGRRGLTTTALLQRLAGVPVELFDTVVRAD